MISLYLIGQNTILTDSTGEDIKWLREQAAADYEPKIIKVKRLTITHRMANYVQATVTYPESEKPVFITCGGGYVVYERKEA